MWPSVVEIARGGSCLCPVFPFVTWGWGSARIVLYGLPHLAYQLRSRGGTEGSGARRRHHQMMLMLILVNIHRTLNYIPDTVLSKGFTRVNACNPHGS